MHWLAICSNDCHAMTFDRHLSWTYRCECVYQTESIATPWRDGEYLQRSVCHEAGVWVTELTSPVDQHRLWILAGVNGQSAGISFSGVLVQPITIFRWKTPINTKTIGTRMECNASYAGTP